MDRLKQKWPWLVVTLYLIYLVVINIINYIGMYQYIGFKYIFEMYNQYNIVLNLIFPLLGFICSTIYFFRDIFISKIEKVSWMIMAVAYFLISLYINSALFNGTLSMYVNPNGVMFRMILDIILSFIFVICVIVGIKKRNGKKSRITQLLSILTLLALLYTPIMLFYFIQGFKPL